jgi:hypothetical protein
VSKPFGAPRAANRKKNEPALFQLSKEDAAPGNPVLIPLLSKSGITCYLGIATNHSFKRARHFQIVSPQRCAVTKLTRKSAKSSTRAKFDAWLIFVFAFTNCRRPCFQPAVSSMVESTRFNSLSVWTRTCFRARGAQMPRISLIGFSTLVLLICCFAEDGPLHGDQFAARSPLRLTTENLPFCRMHASSFTGP